MRPLAIVPFGWIVFIMAIAYFSYRKGERWAWYVLWYLPVFFVYLLVNDLAVGGSSSSVVILFLIISLIGLLLPYRRLFPKSS